MNASKFRRAEKVYNNEFKRILNSIVSCYFLMLKDRTKLSNDEDQIKCRLYKDFLNNNSIRKKLKITHLRFDCDSPEIGGNYCVSGCPDLKISLPINLKKTEAYYLIECKRINGYSFLNREYIREGILRFVSGKYPSYYRVTGMLGFVVRRIDINQNIYKINRLLKKDYPKSKTIVFLNKKHSIDKFNYFYLSRHKNSSNRVINIYHLMLDYSSLILN